MSFFKKKNKNDVKKETFMFPTIDENVLYFRDALYNTDDLKTRTIRFNGIPGVIIYLETIANSEELQRSLLIPLSQANTEQSIDTIITSSQFSKTSNMNIAVTTILKGNSVLFFEHGTEFYILNTLQLHSRSPEEPENEKIVRGSHEGFVGNLKINLNLIRMRIQNRCLKIEYVDLGWETNTQVAIVYLEEIANPELVDEIRKRIKSISSDMIFSPGYIEEFIEDKPLSPFQQILYTERPDRVEAHLVEGRIAIFSEGTSDVSIMPVSFFAFFQSPDDFNIRFYAGSVFRLLRFLSFWGAITLPSIYIAVISFHFELIPNDVITVVKSSIENIPFPPFIEALIMAVTIELIREAGIRLPSPIGQTIGIVGGLIIGESVVNAGLVSNVMVIVIALTAIMSFTIPSYEISNTARLLSLPIMIAAATLGFVGIIFCLMIIVIHLCKLESLGTPYLAPFAPLKIPNLKDSIVRFPIWMLNKRPKNIKPQKIIKQSRSREWDKNEK
ncbi:spore germination protein [Bacillus sp. FJAT-49711]|uniref:spore germination protein n=1 Tax=Bacillus sp. FJAT-49711 TaxID=2833585 RepID=UPI001BC8DBF0|nr:spore germination protein [Bacillus sp. FJAT-49711]MBS4219380.1 spore germination protein [Bacillus sp. FJAT-49711]